MHEEDIKMGSSLEPFLLLAKNARGAAAAQLVNQVTEAPGIFVFSELLNLPNIKELESDPQYNTAWKLLRLFAFGTLADYKEKLVNEIQLTQPQLNKLKLLTIATLASQSKYVPYEMLLNQLDIGNLRELEDVVIDAIYAQIISCKLDPKEKRLEVEYVIGRDIQYDFIDSIIDTLDKWCSNCESCIAMMDSEIDKTNSIREKHTAMKRSVETEIENIKQTLKIQDMQHQGIDPDTLSSSQLSQKSSSKLKLIKSAAKGSTSRTK